jgi:hypothetical protein
MFLPQDSMEPFEYNPIDLNRPSFRLVRLLKGYKCSKIIQCKLFDAWLDPEVLIPYEGLSYVWGGSA